MRFLTQIFIVMANICLACLKNFALLIFYRCFFMRNQL